jgi:hypothetical protein
VVSPLQNNQFQKKEHDMISRFSNRYGKLIIAGAVVIAESLLGLGAVPSAKANTGQTGPENKLVGTWRVQVTPVNSVSGVKLPTFQSLLSFAAGGTLTETTSNPMFQPGQRSIGLGIWTDSGSKTYQAVSEAYIQFSTPKLPGASPSNPPAPGFIRGTQRITQTIQVNGDQFSADAVVQFFDETGNEVTKLSHSATGERIK